MEVVIKNIFRKRTLLDLSMILVFTLFVFYLLSTKLRLLIEVQNIDAGIASAFVASLALMYSIRQSIIDKRFAYNSSIVSRIEDVGSTIIGKLLKIDNGAGINVYTAENIKMCIDTNKVYIDVNDILATFDLGSDADKVASYIQIYFPTEHQNWNEILRISGEIGTTAANISTTTFSQKTNTVKSKTTCCLT